MIYPLQLPAGYCYRALGLITLMIYLTGCSKTVFHVKQPLEDTQKNECVVLLHGLGRTYKSMLEIQTVLTEAGYHSVNLDYPSRRSTIEYLAENYVPGAIERCEQFQPLEIHFVTHSLGGIIIRTSFKQGTPEHLGLVLMLSPPNHGSEIAGSLQNNWLYQWINGPAGQQLSTAPSSLPNRLGPVDYPVGVITGDRHAWFDGFFSNIILGPDDGKVAVKSAKLQGMADFLVVHVSHPYIMKSDYVQNEILYFLERGKFSQGEDAQKISPN